MIMHESLHWVVQPFDLWVFECNFCTDNFYILWQLWSHYRVTCVEWYEKIIFDEFESIDKDKFMSYFRIRSQHKIGVRKPPKFSHCSQIRKWWYYLGIWTHVRFVTTWDHLVSSCDFCLLTKEFTKTTHLMFIKHQCLGAQSSLRIHSRSVN
jgi:hypothetical protein